MLHLVSGPIGLAGPVDGGAAVSRLVRYRWAARGKRSRHQVPVVGRKIERESLLLLVMAAQHAPGMRHPGHPPPIHEDNVISLADLAPLWGLLWK